MSDILVALGNVFTIGNLAGLIFGTGAGILIGAMPGLSVNMRFCFHLRLPSRESVES